MLSNLISFFDGMNLKYNNGNRTRDIVTFISADFVDDMQIKCKIKLSNNTIILADPEMLNFIEIPDIESILQTSEEYCCKCTNIWPEDLQHVLTPKSLSPLQEEMLSHHYRLHHTLFPKLIVLAKRGLFPSNWLLLKDAVSFAWLIYLVKHTSAHGNQNQNKNILFANPLMMHLVNERLQIG
jgi:hypothetical protein